MPEVIFLPGGRKQVILEQASRHSIAMWEEVDMSDVHVKSAENGPFFKTEPDGVLLAWAERLSVKQLKAASDNGSWGLAHELAFRKIFPEKFCVPEILEIRDDKEWSVAHWLARTLLLPEHAMTTRILSMIRYEDGLSRTAFTAAAFTVAEDYLNAVVRHNRWDILFPKILAEDCYLRRDRLRVVTLAENALRKKNSVELENAVASMPLETLSLLFKKGMDPNIRLSIAKFLDRIAASNIFEQDEEQNLHSGGQEKLYEMERG